MARLMSVHCCMLCFGISISSVLSSEQVASSNCEGKEDELSCQPLGSTGDRSIMLQQGVGVREASHIDVNDDKQEHADEHLSHAELLQKLHVLEAKLAESDNQDGIPDFEAMVKKAKETAQAALVTATQALTTGVNQSMNVLQRQADVISSYALTHISAENLTAHINASVSKEKQLAGLALEVEVSLQEVRKQLVLIRGSIQMASVTIHNGLTAVGQTQIAAPFDLVTNISLTHLDQFTKVLDASASRLKLTSSEDGIAEQFDKISGSLREALDNVRAFKESQTKAFDAFINGVLKTLKSKLPETAYDSVSKPLLLVKHRAHHIFDQLSGAIEREINGIIDAMQKQNDWGAPQLAVACVVASACILLALYFAGWL